MGHRMTALLVVLAFLSSAQVPASEVADWSWDRDTPVCSLQQQLPSGDEIHVIRTPGNDETEVEITLKQGSRLKEAPSRPAWIVVAPGGNTLADVSTGVDETDRPQIYAVTQEPAFVTRFAGSTKLQISGEGYPSSPVEVRSAAAAIAALRACEDEKMREWGLDPVAMRGLRSWPAPSEPIRKRFRDLDYPAAALANAVEADTVTRLEIGPDGRVRDCVSVNSGDYRGFEQAACAALTGARFKPAVDATGKAVSSYYVYDVRFRIAR